MVTGEMIIRFDKDRYSKFELENFNSLTGLVGLYFISVPQLSIPYPFKKSSLIYIGMSESRINSIGNRLKDHISGRSSNKGILGYSSKWPTMFTYLEWDYLKHFFPDRTVEVMEGRFLDEFSKEFGTYPICNNKRGELLGYAEEAKELSFEIDWKFFEEGTL